MGSKDNAKLNFHFERETWSTWSWIRFQANDMEASSLSMDLIKNKEERRGLPHHRMGGDNEQQTTLCSPKKFVQIISQDFESHCWVTIVEPHPFRLYPAGTEDK